jgi:hypothetical protein
MAASRSSPASGTTALKRAASLVETLQVPFPARNCKDPAAGVADRLRRTVAPCHRPGNCRLRHATNCPAGSVHADSCSNAEPHSTGRPSAPRSGRPRSRSHHASHLPAIGSADKALGRRPPRSMRTSGTERVPARCAPRTMGIGKESPISTRRETVRARRGTRLLDHEPADADRVHDVIRSPTRRWHNHRRADDLSVPRCSKLPASAPTIETLALTACGPARLSLPPKRFTRLYTYVNG